MGLLLAIGTSFAVGLTSYLALKKKDNVVSSSNSNINIDCLNTTCTFQFNWNGDLIKQQVNKFDNVFYLLDKKILYTDDVGLLSRLIFSEAGNCSYAEKIAVGEVVLNRKNDKTSNSDKYCWNRYFSKYNTIYEVITKTGFLGVNTKRFYPKQYFKYPIEKQTYIDCIGAAIKVIYQRTNWFKNALYFNKGGVSPCEKSFYKISPDNFKHSVYAPKD